MANNGVEIKQESVAGVMVQDGAREVGGFIVRVVRAVRDLFGNEVVGTQIGPPNERDGNGFEPPTSR